MTAEKLKDLYAKEINFTIAAFFDLGFTFYLGDRVNGYKWKETFPGEEFDKGVDRLYEMAAEMYPEKGWLL